MTIGRSVHRKSVVSKMIIGAAGINHILKKAAKKED
jgi:hypothetical protein